MHALGFLRGFLCNICRVRALESIAICLIIPKLCIYDKHDFFCETSQVLLEGGRVGFSQQSSDFFSPND